MAFDNNSFKYEGLNSLYEKRENFFPDKVLADSYTKYASKNEWFKEKYDLIRLSKIRQKTGIYNYKDYRRVYLIGKERRKTFFAFYTTTTVKNLSI